MDLLRTIFFENLIIFYLAGMKILYKKKRKKFTLEINRIMKYYRN
jgi:hypothetical protein